jgi:hypothetical protein
MKHGLIVIAICCAMIAEADETSAQELDLIFSVTGDYPSESMGYHAQSPGDYDGDGYPEVFVASNPDDDDSNFVRVFDGGDPPSSEAMKVYRFPLPCAITLLDDLNCDGLPEVCMRYGIPGESMRAVDIHLSRAGFYSSDSADIAFRGSFQRIFGGKVYSADTDADGENELIIAETASATPLRTRFFIYEAGCDLDTIPEHIIAIDTSITSYSTIANCLGDINGDGYADYATSSWGNETPSHVLIYYGSSDTDSIPEHDMSSPWGDNRFGRDLVPLGDINNDEYDDFVIISSHRSPAVFYGGNPFDTAPLFLEYPGSKASRCGDLNGDGWDDIAIGYPEDSGDWGALYVYFGSSHMDTIADVQIRPHDVHPTPNSFGKSVGPAGDFNGDGIQDLAVGSDEFFLPGSDMGYLWVFSGVAGTESAEDQTQGVLPESYVILKQNTPNPFNASTMIEYELLGAQSREIDLSIFNILGQKVLTLRSGSESAGVHKLFWDARNDSGEPVNSGMYFYVLKSGNQSFSKKMLLLK